MKMKYLLFLVAISISLSGFSQFIEDDNSTQTEQKAEPKFTDHLFFGGNLGITLGSYTYINISPIVGYRIQANFSAGVGIIYEYFNDKRVQGYEYTTSIYGGKIFTQYVLLDKIILYGENNIISLEKRYFDVTNNFPNDGRYIIDVPWIGGGLYQKMGNGGAYILFLFNLNQNRNSPYNPYEFRVGFNF